MKNKTWGYRYTWMLSAVITTPPLATASFFYSVVTSSGAVEK